MRIAICHLGNPSYSIPATSVLKKLSDPKYACEVTWVSHPEYTYIFKHNKYIKKSISIKELNNEQNKYDALINLFPIQPTSENSCVATEKIGFCYSSATEKIESIIIDKKENTNINIFQAYFKIMGWEWKGDGYNLCYYPKSKQKKNRIGVSVANSNLRNYILDNLKMDNSKIWHIPFRKNIFKKMDEINKCEKIITDDLTTMHLSLYLKKYVHFLETFPIPLKLEFFNSGEKHKVKLENI